MVSWHAKSWNSKNLNGGVVLLGHRFPYQIGHDSDEFLFADVSSMDEHLIIDPNFLDFGAFVNKAIPLIESEAMLPLLIIRIGLIELLGKEEKPLIGIAFFDLSEHGRTITATPFIFFDCEEKEVYHVTIFNQIGKPNERIGIIYSEEFRLLPSNRHLKRRALLGREGGNKKVFHFFDINGVGIFSVENKVHSTSIKSQAKIIKLAFCSFVV